MTVKKLFVNVALLVVSMAIAICLCEAASRIFLRPADYLSVDMVPDEILGAVPAPGTKGFDRWGFRNRDVPETADLVAVGDSHTYGNTARMDESFPYVVARLSGQRAYNMGMGGYGPNQYFQLLKTRALTLKPKTILCGLYMGDDFENAFGMTYGLDHWAYLRERGGGKADFDIWEAPPVLGWGKSIRVWLSRHSVTYQLVVHGPFGGQLQGEAQIRNAPQSSDAVTSLVLPEENILEAFRPTSLLRGLDQDNENVREGMRITFRLLKEMNEISIQNHIRFIVVVIPTKESVFAKYLEHNAKLPLSNVLDQLIANERLARERTFTFLSDFNIAYVDTLPALRGSLQHELYARTAADMHPSKNGYGVIGEAVYGVLRQSAGESGVSQSH